jgi:hypothetical protein
VRVCGWGCKKRVQENVDKKLQAFFMDPMMKKHKLILLPKFVILWLGLPERVSLWQV